MSTGNIVTLCCTTACGSIFSTVPKNGRSGKASIVTFTSWPGLSPPTSVSFTRARLRTFDRSAICTSVVPPPTALSDEVMIVPSETFFVMIVPEIGARTTASSSRCRAMSSEARAPTT